MFGTIACRLTTRSIKVSFLAGLTTTSAFCYTVTPRMPPGHKIHQQTNLQLERVLPSIQKELHIKTLMAKSPLYPDKERTYEGYDLLEVLSALKMGNINQDLVIFEAKDGFKSFIPLTLIQKYKPILAVRQTSPPLGRQAWEVVDHPLNGKTDGGPFYLMWPEPHGKEVIDNHWAFGVMAITFGSFQKIFGALAPSSDQHRRGFELFAQNCVCCHSFFKQGTANVGPAVEDLSKKFIMSGSIAEYAANPPGYSIMPKQELTPQELKKIEAYIRFKTEEGPSPMP